MKIKKFNEKINYSTKKYHVFAYHLEDAEEPDLHIFEKEEDAFNYTLNIIYNIFNERNWDVDDLDEYDGLDGLYEMYTELCYDENLPQYLFYNNIPMTSGVELEDWIKVKRDAKKYNL